MKLLVDGMLADIARLGSRDDESLNDLRAGWSAMLKGASAAEVVGLCKVLRDRLPEGQGWLADDILRHHPETERAG
ncbi:MAG: hypothetical protein K0R83_2804 [Caulobacter sp.]|nr:hypothetical protein [Caulobacter sp.]